jgi:carboxyl-terminal processing protease
MHRLHSRSARRIMFRLLAILALTGCATPQIAASDGDTGRLFSRAYQQVMDYYIEPLTARDVALPAMARLSTLAPAIRIAAEGGDVVLYDGTAAAERFPAPAPSDARGWGELTSAALQRAEARSAELRASTPEHLAEALFAGITGALDRFSRYATPELAREQRASREGFEGIGVTLDTRGEEVRVSAVVPGSPAERAGVKVDDRIVEIDGAPAGAMPRDEVVRRLRGPVDSHVTLTLERPRASSLLHVSLARAYIIVPTVTAQREGNVAVLRVSGFNEHTTDSLRESYVKLHKEMRAALHGIILDLRGNPGGLLDQGIAVAELFMTGGRIATTIGRSPGSVQEFDASPGDIAAGIPMVVLVNGGSASSAEIVAAALQDSGRAVIVGTSSYGKGTVQTVLPLPNEGELTLTWARLVTPAGYALHTHGIVPAVCTSGLREDAEVIVATLRQSTAHIEPRVTLDEAGWTRLRHACPSETADHKVEIDAAETLLADPTLYARLIHAEPTAIASKPEATGAPQ